MEGESFNLLLFLLTWLGAFGGHVFSLNQSQNYVGTSIFFRKITPQKSDQFYAIADLILAPLLGGLLVYLIAGPESARTSIICGLTWSGTVTAVIGNKKEEEDV